MDEYRVSALDTGEVHTLHIAGDVVLSAPGIELEHLETPPSTFGDVGEGGDVGEFED